MKALLALCIVLSGCATVDSVFGPPTQEMTQREVTDFCIKNPNDNVCQRWFKGDPPKCKDCLKSSGVETQAPYGYLKLCADKPDFPACTK